MPRARNLSELWTLTPGLRLGLASLELGGRGSLPIGGHCDTPVDQRKAVPLELLPDSLQRVQVTGACGIAVQTAKCFSRGSLRSAGRVSRMTQGWGDSC